MVSACCKVGANLDRLKIGSHLSHNIPEMVWKIFLSSDFSWHSTRISTIQIDALLICWNTYNHNLNNLQYA